MNQDVLRLFAALTERIIAIDEWQIASIKNSLQRFDAIESSTKLRADLERMDDPEAASALRAKLDSVESKYAEKNAEINRQFLDTLARVESDHEKAENILAKLKASLKS